MRAKKLSILVPMYNEESTVGIMIDAVLAVQWPKEMAIEIVLVDDGSTDRTAEVAKAKSANFSVIQVHELANNVGKGAAIRHGLQELSGDVVIIQDADMEYFAEDIPGVVGPIFAGKAEVVYGSRFLGEFRNMRWPNKVANWMMNMTANVLFGCRLTDEATAYKAFRADVIRRLPLTCHRFEFCPEVTGLLRRYGYHIHEVPIRYVARTFAQGKKIRWTDLVHGIYTLFRVRLKPLPPLLPGNTPAQGR